MTTKPVTVTDILNDSTVSDGFQFRATVGELRALVAESPGVRSVASAVAILLSACDWLHKRGHKSAATDLDCNWNDGPPGDGTCRKLHLIEPEARSVASAGDGRRYHRGALGIVDVVHESGGWVHYRAVGAKQRLPAGNFRSLYRECEPFVAEEAQAPVAAPAASAGDGREVSVYDMSNADYEQLENAALAAWRSAYCKWADEADKDDADTEHMTTNTLCPGEAREAYTDGYRAGYLSALESAPAAKPVESLAGLLEQARRVAAEYRDCGSIGDTATELLVSAALAYAADNSLPAPPEESK